MSAESHAGNFSQPRAKLEPGPEKALPPPAEAGLGYRLRADEKN